MCSTPPHCYASPVATYGAECLLSAPPQHRASRESGVAVDKTMWTERARALISLRAAVTVALLLALLVAAEPARAAPTTFTVNSTDDAGDATLDGTCDSDDSAPGDQCTLRAAIQEANTTTDRDTIDFNIPSTDCDDTSG